MLKDFLHGEPLSLIEGRLEEFVWAHSSATLLQLIGDRYQQKRISSGVRTARGQIQLTLSAGGALEGYEEACFAALLGSRVVCGYFEDANHLQSGDQISAVVSQQGDLYHVHSLRRESDNLLLLPWGDVCGNGAFFNRGMKEAWRVTKLSWIFFGAIFVVQQMLGDSLEGGNFLLIMLFVLVGPPLIMFPMEYHTYRNLGPVRGYAEAIFKAYGIPHADEFDALKGMDAFHGAAGVIFAPNYAKAMHEHAKKFHIAL